MRDYRFSNIAGLLTIPAVMAALPAHAQPTSTGRDASAISSAANTQGVEDIVVTANRREQNMQDVPIAISVVSQARLDAIRIRDARDLGQVVAGLTITSDFGNTQAYIRGVGSNIITIGAENSVATYIDNVYMMSAFSGPAQLSSVQQVEVLKGPQGTLFGRNATGGVINIRTRDPKHEASGSFTLDYGNYDTLVGKGYLTAGITKDLAADISFFVTKQGKGWGRNLFDGTDAYKSNQYAVRSKWLFEPGDRDKFRLIIDYYDQVQGSTAFAALPGTAVNYGPGNVTAAERASRVGPDGNPTADALAYQGYIAGGAVSPFAVVGNPYVFPGGFYDTDVAVHSSPDTKAGGTSLQWDHDFGNVRLMSVTAYRRIEYDNGGLAQNVPTPAPVSYFQLERTDNQYTQELQLGSAAGASIPWVVGVYYLQGSGETPVFNIHGSALIPLETLAFPSSTKTKSGAVFGQATAPLWSGAHLTVGLRYTADRRSIKGDTSITLLPAFGGFTIVTPATPVHKTFRKLTWRLALDQQLTPGILAYASYNRGFKSGLFNAVPPGGKPVDPEVLDAFEVGLKSDLLDRKLRLNVSAFYYSYKNLQVSVYTPVAVITDNGAGARLYGLDVDFTARITPQLTLTGGGNLMHSEFTSYPQAGFFTILPASAGGGTVRTVGSAKGNRIPFAPDFTFNVGANYVAPVAGGEARFNVNYAYSSKFYSTPSNDLSLRSRGLLDASLEYEFQGGQWTAGIWARNITAEKYYVSASFGPNPGGTVFGAPGAPRTYGATVGFKF